MSAKKTEIKKTFFQKFLYLAPIHFLVKIFTVEKNSPEESHKMREKMSEKKVDKMIKDSFPASDPPSTY